MNQGAWAAITAAIITSGVAIIIAIIKFLPIKTRHFSDTNHFRGLGDRVKRIEDANCDCQAGKTQQCIDHEKTIATVKAEIKHIKELITNLSDRITRFRSDVNKKLDSIDNWMKEH